MKKKYICVSCKYEITIESDMKIRPLGCPACGKKTKEEEAK